ncbi:hypothetical protein PAMP_020272 [Pampus punctatissimus]
MPQRAAFSPRSLLKEKRREVVVSSEQQEGSRCPPQKVDWLTPLLPRHQTAIVSDKRLMKKIWRRS